MLAAFINRIADHIPGFKRRATDNSDEIEPPLKHARLTTTSEMSSNQGIGKENHESDEIVVVSEKKSPGWISPRKSVKPSKVAETSTPIEGLKFASRTRRMVELARAKPVPIHDDVEIVQAMRDISVDRTNRYRSMRERIFRPFRQPKGPLMVSMKRRPHNNAENYLKLHDKMTYGKLLEMYMKPASPSLSLLTQQPPKKEIPVITLFEPDMQATRVMRDREASNSSIASRAAERPSNDFEVISEVKGSPPVKVNHANSLQDYIRRNPNLLTELDVKSLVEKHKARTREKQRLALLEEGRLAALTSHNEKTCSEALEDRVREYMKITEPPILDIEEEEYKLPELTDEQELNVKNAFRPTPAQEILANKFDIQITRKDISTLKGLEWLNDAVINFYMNLIIERSKKNTSLPKVFCFNTFFHFNVTNKRFGILRRWTRKFDLFDYDLVFAPVHLQVHWCMSAVDFRSKEIRYYDSMGSCNSSWLDGFMEYLEYESQDKKKKPFDKTGWKLINVADIPQQMNGSDCGVFACMFAEHLARDAPLLFSQHEMPYFRRKMVTEIIEGELLT